MAWTHQVPLGIRASNLIHALLCLLGCLRLLRWAWVLRGLWVLASTTERVVFACALSVGQSCSATLAQLGFNILCKYAWVIRDQQQLHQRSACSCCHVNA